MKFGVASLLFVVICVQLLWIPTCVGDSSVDQLDPDGNADAEFGGDRCKKYVNSRPSSNNFGLFSENLWKRGPCKVVRDAKENELARNEYQKEIERIVVKNWFEWFATSVSFIG